MKPPILLPRFVWTGPVITLGNDFEKMRFRRADSLVSCGRKAYSCNNVCSFKNIWICVNEARNKGFHDFFYHFSLLHGRNPKIFCLNVSFVQESQTGPTSEEDWLKWWQSLHLLAFIYIVTKHWLEVFKSSYQTTFNGGRPSVMLHFTGSLLRLPPKQVGALPHLPRQKRFSRSPLSGYKQNSPNNGKVNEQRTF